MLDEGAASKESGGPSQGWFAVGMGVVMLTVLARGSRAESTVREWMMYHGMHVRLIMLIALWHKAIAPSMLQPRAPDATSKTFPGFMRHGLTQCIVEQGERDKG